MCINVYSVRCNKKIRTKVTYKAPKNVKQNKYTLFNTPRSWDVVHPKRKTKWNAAFWMENSFVRAETRRTMPQQQ